VASDCSASYETFSQCTTTQTHVNMTLATQPPTCLAQLTRLLSALASERLPLKPAATTGASWLLHCGPRTHETSCTPDYNQLHGRLQFQCMIVARLVKKSPAVYGTRRLITVFTKAPHTPSCPNSEPMNSVHNIKPSVLKLYFNMTFPSTPRSPSCFPLGFPTICLRNTQTTEQNQLQQHSSCT
jgi:hypothetical protein